MSGAAACFDLGCLRFRGCFQVFFNVIVCLFQRIELGLERADPSLNHGLVIGFVLHQFGIQDFEFCGARLDHRFDFGEGLLTLFAD